jgi:hypothetical protein
MAGRAPFTKPGREDRSPGELGEILLGLAAPGTPGRTSPGFNGMRFLLFLLAASPGLLGTIFGSSFFFLGLLN